MNYKRAFGFGILFWIFAFVIISIIMFLPWFKNSNFRIMIAWWVVEIPVVLLMAKWYFRQRKPNLKEGFFLGLIALLTGIILDSLITVPLFSQADYLQYFGNWTLYIGFLELLILTTLSGWEFDAPVAKT